MKTQHTVKIMLTLTLILSVAMVAVYVLFFLSFSAVRDARLRMENDHALQKNIKTTLENNAKKATNLISRQNDVFGLFIKNGEEASFISSTEALCGELSLSCTIRSLEVASEAGAPASVSLFKLTVDSEGSFENVMSLLNRFENSHYPIKLSLLDLSTERGASTGGTNTKEAVWRGTFSISLPELAQ